MKYIISDNRLSGLMLDYLDERLIGGVSRIDSYIVVHDKSDYDETAHDGIIFEYDSSDGRLYINGEFLDNFYSFFPVGVNNIKELIKVWFESKFHVEIKYVYSGYSSIEDAEEPQGNLNEAFDIRYFDLIQYVKNLFKKKQNDFRSNVTPEMEYEYKKICNMMFKLVKDKLDLRVIKDIEVVTINVNNFGKNIYDEYIERITVIVEPIVYDWANISKKRYAQEYEELKKAFNEMEKMMAMNYETDTSKRTVSFNFRWDMRHRI